MKKILAILLAAMMLLSLAACGDNNKPDADKDNPGASQNGGENNNGEENNNGGESNDNGGESSDNGGESQPTDEDTFESRMVEIALPGLAMPEGCTYEKASQAVFKGAKLTKEAPWTTDEAKAFIRSVWTLCSELTAHGIFDGSLTDGKVTINKEYGAITEKYSEFDTAELDGFELIWNYTYEGSVYQLKMTQASGSQNVYIYTYRSGTIAE